MQVNPQRLSAGDWKGLEGSTVTVTGVNPVTEPGVETTVTGRVRLVTAQALFVEGRQTGFTFGNVRALEVPDGFIDPAGERSTRLSLILEGARAVASGDRAAMDAFADKVTTKA